MDGLTLDDAALRDASIWDAICEGMAEDHVDPIGNATQKVVRYLAEAGFAIVRLPEGLPGSAG